MTHDLADDRGSVLPITIGYAMLALVMALLCANATSLYLEQKRLDGLADAAALAGADGFTLIVEEGGARPILSDAEVHAQADAVVQAAATGAVLVSATTPDGVSARVRVAGEWRPAILTLFVPEGVRLEATGTSRNALR